MKVFYKSNKKDFDACAELKDMKIVVLKGSKIAKKVNNFKMVKSAQNYRNDSNSVDNNYIVKKDLLFESASAAAQFVSGASIDGKIAWKDSNGNSLRKLKK